MKRPQEDCEPDIVRGACASEAMRQRWGGRPVRQKEAQGILVAALGMLAGHLGYGAAKGAS